MATSEKFKRTVQRLLKTPPQPRTKAPKPRKRRNHREIEKLMVAEPNEFDKMMDRKRRAIRRKGPGK